MVSLTLTLHSVAMFSLQMNRMMMMVVVVVALVVVVAFLQSIDLGPAGTI